MRTFKGSLREGDYHVGTFITTSSFSNPALESAEKGYIQLINGDRLADIMLQSDLGVVEDGEDMQRTGIFGSCSKSSEMT